MKEQQQKKHFNFLHTKQRKQRKQRKRIKTKIKQKQTNNNPENPS
jgi:hypothetical protein